MSASPTSVLVAARDWRSDWHERWLNADQTTRVRVQVGVFVVVVLLAYHYSLSSLLQTLDLETPLAYLGLVPLIAVGLAVLRSRQGAHEPAIYDRQVDYIVGVPLLVAALAINLVLPRRLSTMFWVWRIDLLSFPIFVAGVATVIFGVRAVWRQRLAIGYLFLAWPLPYTDLLLKELNAVTAGTLHALSALVHLFRVATLIPGSGGSVFGVSHHGRVFQLSVVSACSGVNGMVGFLLVGIAFGAIVTGPWLRKTIWLAGGLFLLWVINLGRILLIFWAGQRFGEHFAISVLHPFVGLVTFNIGILVMVFMLRPAGLSIGGPSGVFTGGSGATRSRTPLAVPSVYSAIAVVAVFGLILGVNNTGLEAYNLVAQANGEPKLASYLLNPGSPAGWAPTFAAEYDFAKPYFGESSLWYRYTYSPSVGATDLHSSLPVVADVINSSSLTSFSAYGVDACYKFHGYKLHDVTQVSLGGGITGQALSYTSSGADPQDWSIVYWIWPVINGTSTRYERIILYMLGGTQASVSAPGVSFANASTSSIQVNDEELVADRGFLAGFAREIIQAQARITVGSTLSSSTQTYVRPSAADIARLRAAEQARNAAAKSGSNGTPAAGSGGAPPTVGTPTAG